MSPHEAVAAEVRAQLARNRLSGRRAAEMLGWKQTYMSRRLTGAVPFDVDDLAALAELLDVPIGQFFPDNLTSGGLRTAAPWTLTPLRAAA